jgi:hypothetical protein
MTRRWKGVVAGDRFYHRAFSRQSGIFTDLGTASIADIGAGQASVSRSHGLFQKPLALTAMRPSRREVSLSETIRKRPAVVFNGENQGQEK